MNLPDDTRLPFWLNLDLRKNLEQVCKQALRSTASGTHDASHLNDILIELAVAGARDSAWPGGGTALRSAAGWSRDVLPIRMNPQETAALLRHTDSSDLHTVFTSTNRHK